VPRACQAKNNDFLKTFRRISNELGLQAISQYHAPLPMCA